MRCVWQPFIQLLPQWMRPQVDSYADSLQELRLRIGCLPELVTAGGSHWLQKLTSIDDLNYCINAATRYSPWTAGTSINGYITAQGGHRIGLCGQYVSGSAGISRYTSLCLRVARDYDGISDHAWNLDSSLLIIGRPGSGKTTLLRDLIRQRSEKGCGSVAVIDEKGEIFPYIRETPCFSVGKRTDILTGCSKPKGIEMLLRNMSPETVAVDEITAQEDCNALIHAGWCGVKLLATAHAASKKDLLSRPVYRPLLDTGLFRTLLVLQPDKTWRAERMD